MNHICNISFYASTPGRIRTGGLLFSGCLSVLMNLKRPLRGRRSKVTVKGQYGGKQPAALHLAKLALVSLVELRAIYVIEEDPTH